MKNLVNYIDEAHVNSKLGISYNVNYLTNSLCDYIDEVCKKQNLVDPDTKEDIKNAFAALDWETIIEMVNEYTGVAGAK